MTCTGCKRVTKHRTEVYNLKHKHRMFKNPKFEMKKTNDP